MAALLRQLSDSYPTPSNSIHSTDRMQYGSMQTDENVEKVFYPNLCQNGHKRIYWSKATVIKGSIDSICLDCSRDLHGIYIDKKLGICCDCKSNVLCWECMKIRTTKTQKSRKARKNNKVKLQKVFCGSVL